MVPGSIPGSALNFITVRQYGRVVKATDLKSVGHSPRRFKSCYCRRLSVAQLVERQTVEVKKSNLLVAGSIPVAEKLFSASVRAVKELPLGGNVAKRASSNLASHIKTQPLWPNG